MPSPFTIVQGKDTKKSLFLVSVTSPDGNVCYLTTGNGIGAARLTYAGTDYMSRILNNDLQAVQAMSPQGYDSIPGFTLTIADGDGVVWNNYCVPHGWRGSTVVLTAILWDYVNNQYSTDAIQWTFIGGNPQHDYSRGQTTLDATSATNFTRLKVPSVPLEFRCPWDFPTTLAERTAALNDPSSIFYQCGYSPDVSGGVGNYQSGTTPFTTCEKVRSSPGDPSVGCMARMGNPSGTSVAPDGDLTHDIAGHYTGRFGGATWVAPMEFSGRAYTSGQKTFGYNTQNTSLVGTYYNWVYGTQWVDCQVLAPAGEPNSVRGEAVVCVSAFGNAYVRKLLVNGVEVPYLNSDQLLTWRYVTQGGRNGALCADAIFNKKGDPHGSLCVVEFVVPAQLAQPGSVPRVQALVTGGPILNCYAIDHVTAGVATFTGPNWSCSSDLTVVIKGNSNSSLNGVWTLTSATGGNPGTITLNGAGALSGTGGAAFFFATPDLRDQGGTIVSGSSGTEQNIAWPAANLAFAVLDLMAWGNITLDQIDGASWYQAAQDCAQLMDYVGSDGVTRQHAQFKASFALNGTQRQVLSSVLTALRNGGNLMISPNSTTGKIQCFTRKTLADQQPATISGSNYNTAVSSKKADGTAANGYFAYVFDEGTIEKDSFRITTTRIESTPNLVATQFQNEYNGYQTDSLTTINDKAYKYSGNQEVAVPVPMMGAPNFDQNTRVGNVQLAEALYGNSRNDPGGTLFFEFKVNQRVLHLASRLGYICGLHWRPRNIGVSSPQPIRILSMKPDTDGDHWDIKAAWHLDDWYTYAFGQNPEGYLYNYIQQQSAAPPLPWRPGHAIWGASDALFPSQDGFDLAIDTSQSPAQLQITGVVPNNQQQTSLPPVVPSQGSTANTGGSIAPGTYLIAFSTNGLAGPVSKNVMVIVPAGTSTNKITISNIIWQSGAAPSIQPFVGTSTTNMRAAAGASYTSTSPDSHGNPTSFTFTAITTDGAGLPDNNMSGFLVEEISLAHGGVWGDTVGSVASNVLTFPSGAWTTNQWAGRVLSLYYRPGVSQQPALNISVTSSTSNTLTMASTGFLAGDVVVMRAASTHISSNTIGDDQLVNSYAPGGLVTDQEKGRCVFIIAGTGAGQPPKTIKSNTSTVLTIEGSWDVTPDATSVWIVIESNVNYKYETGVVVGSGVDQTIASMPAKTPAAVSQEQSLLVRVSTVDSNGNRMPVQYQPFRELYVPAQLTSDAPTVTVSSNTTLGAYAQKVLADASGGPITVTFPPFSSWLTLTITITKSDASANAVTWQTSGGSDVVVGEGTSGTIATTGETIYVTALQ